MESLLDRARAFLRDKPGYLKKSPQTLAERLSIDEDTADSAIRSVKAARRAHQDIADEHGLDGFRVKSAWQGADGRMKYSYERSEEEEADDREAFKESLLADIKAQFANVPRKVLQPSFEDSGMLATFNFCDIHIGKDAWSLSEAVEKMQGAFETAIAMAKARRVEHVLLPVGHDLIQIDYEHISRSGTVHTTSSGTPVTKSNNSWFSLYRASRALCSWMLRRLKEEGFPTTVLVIPGNHAHQSELAIGDALAVEFAGDPSINVVVDEGADKVFSWGDCGFLLTHGHRTAFDELPLHFAIRYPELFCRSRWRTILTGHKHISKKRGVGDWDNGKRGVNLYISPSLSPQDQWHHTYGYDGYPAFDVFFHHKERGFAGMNQTTMPETAMQNTAYLDEVGHLFTEAA